jgi:triphosphatase
VEGILVPPYPVPAYPGTAVHTEIEWQFDAVDIRPVARWLDAWAESNQGGLSTTPAVRIQDRYLDTDDWRLYRAGYSLRVRTRGDSSEATLKALPADGSLRRRVEITEALPDGEGRSPLEAAGSVGRRVRDVCGSRRLQLLCEIKTSRRPYLVQVGEARAEVVLDETTIPLDGGGRPVRLRRVEMEVLQGSPEDLAAFVRELEAGAGLRPATLTKFEAGLLSSGLSAPPLPDLGPTNADASQTLGEVAFAALRKHFHTFLRSEPGTRMGDDPEELHDMRVASRRIRAAFSIFREALPARSERLRQELGWIADGLGAVRDLDVQLERVEEWAQDVPDEGAGGSEIVAALQEARQSAREELLRILDSPRYARFVESFGVMLRRGPLRAQPPAWRPVTAEAPGLVERRRRAVRGKLKDLRQADDKAPALHAVRIRCKRLRYLLEFLGQVYPQEIPDVTAGLVKAQDLLGIYQDSIVGGGRLRDLALAREDPLSPAAVFLLGRFTERYQEQGRRATRRFSKGPSPVGGAPWKRLAKTMKKSQRRTTGTPTVPTMVLAERPDTTSTTPVQAVPIQIVSEV